jgi:hypothetical protein
MKMLSMLLGIALLTACEKSIFKQTIGPENATVGQEVTLDPGVEADSYVWYVEQYTYTNNSNADLYDVHYEKNPVVQWDMVGQYKLHLTTTTNGKMKDYSGFILVN